MKKIIKYALIVILTVFLFNCYLDKTNVEANEEAQEIDFIDFNYTSSKIRENGKMKVKFSCNWKSNKPINITGLQYRIHSQSANIINMPVSKGQNHYVEFIVENWQSGTVELIINYNQVGYEFGAINEEYTKVVYLTTSSWQEAEISWFSSISLGLFATVCVGFATFIIIDHSKKDPEKLTVEESND